MLAAALVTYAHAVQLLKPGRWAEVPASHSLQLASPLTSV